MSKNIQQVPSTLLNILFSPLVEVIFAMNFLKAVLIGDSTHMVMETRRVRTTGLDASSSNEKDRKS